MARFSCRFSWRFKCCAFFLSLLLTFQIGRSLQGLLRKGPYINWTFYRYMLVKTSYSFVSWHSSWRFKCGAIFLSLLLTLQIGCSLQGPWRKGAYIKWTFSGIIKLIHHIDLSHDISLDASNVAQFSCRFSWPFKCETCYLPLLLTLQIGRSLQGPWRKGAYIKWTFSGIIKLIHHIDLSHDISLDASNVAQFSCRFSWPFKCETCYLPLLLTLQIGRSLQGPWRKGAYINWTFSGIF